MSPIRVQLAERLGQLPPYLFAELDRLKQEVVARGVDVISLGIGDPDLPTPPHIIEALCRAAADPANHQYPSYEGMLRFRQAVADWYAARGTGIELDPATEVITLIGSKEGIAHLPWAFVNPGDAVLCPTPGYPVYEAGTLFAHGEVVEVQLLEEDHFLVDYSKIPQGVLERAKVLFLNYPCNPTATCAPRSFYEETIEVAKAFDIIVCHDAAYSEIYYDGKRPLSFLDLPGAKEVGVEFHSLSKTYNMTGWRLGWAAGNPEVVAGLGKIKTNVDSGVFQAVQEAGIAALTGDQGCVAELRATYQRRRDVALAGLARIGLEPITPEAAFYVWIRCPEGTSAADFAARVLQEAGVVITPGTGFGRGGEGYVRMTLTVPEERLEEAIERMGKVV
ncbi:MAG: LL-diaminopimelate aminotransferase [Nitrospirae bacterium]|nr:MAG: LL-diaminopimelate aminotransferase [Nitrospirota bacterium]